MKKFLTLALALVMALALAAPAMAYVSDDYAYDVASEYDLDFYLVDYDESYSLFNRGGVFTELPAADRGYVTNEMVGAVVEVLVPAKNDGGDAYLAISSENVRLNYGITSSNTFREADEAITSKTTADKLENDNTRYVWEWDDTESELWLDTYSVNGYNGTDVTLDCFENPTKKDVTASWLVFGKVLDDEASLTATLYHGSPYNSDLEVDAATPTSYKIGDNKYDVMVYTTYDTDGDKSGYVFIIRPEGADFTAPATDGKVVYIYTNTKWKTLGMIYSNGTESYTDGRVPAESATITITAAQLATNGVIGATFKVGNQTVVNLANGDGYDADAAATYALNKTAIAEKLAADAGAETSTTWTAAVNAAGDIVLTNEPGQITAINVVMNAEPGTAQDVTVTSTTGADASGAITADGVGYYEVVGKNLYLTYADNAGALYVPNDSNAWVEPANVSHVADSGVNKGYLNDVLADFNLDVSKVGNILKPEYLGNYKLGIIEEITLDIQPWQAYVTIPDIEVIDPPKTGDAATLAGFVMIVLAAAGVVVFKKVRA